MSEMTDARTAARGVPARANRVAAMMLMMALSACGGGGGGGDTESPAPPPPPPAPVTLDVTASADSASAGSAAISLHAQVGGSSEVPTWTLEGPGSLSATDGADVQYLPPDTEHLDDPTNATVTASLTGNLMQTVRIALSPVEVPGHHWETVRPSAPNFSSIAYGNGRYVATVYSNVLWVSADGKAWSKVTAGEWTAQYTNAIWGDSGWVAVSVDGSVATSADGLSWTVQSEKLPTGFYTLAAGNHTYVAYTGVANAVASTDGAHWADTGWIWSNLAFGNGLFMGIVDRDVPYRSTDAFHWTATTDPSTYFGLAFANGQFSSNFGDADWHGQTTDGTLWVSTAQPNMTGNLKGAGTTLFALGSYSPLGGYDLGVQPAGGFWQRVAPVNAFAQPVDLAYGPAGYVAVSQVGWITTSTNALDWTTRVEGSYGNLNAAIDFNGSYVAASDRGWILRSTDAKRWTGSALPTTGDGRAVTVQALAHGNGVLVATGCFNGAWGGCVLIGGSSDGAWMRSTDGATWSFASTPAPSDSISGVVHDGQRFVAVSARGDVYASTDGDTWTLISHLAGEPPLQAIAYGGGRYVAVSPLGDIVYSTDGTTWKKSPGIPGVDDQGHAIQRPLRGITWDGRQFVGVGLYLNATSPDGQTWTVSTETTPGGYAVTACGGQLVSVGPGSAESSLDGVTWRSRMPSDGPQLHAVTCGRGRFVAVGYESAISVSDH